MKIYHTTAGEKLSRRYPDDEIKLCGLRHAHVVRVHEGGWCRIGGERRPYVLMDKHPGMDLIYLLRSEALVQRVYPQGLNWQRVFRLVMEGLQAVHQAGFVHLDVDARNVMIDHNRHVTVMDLGLALPMDDTRLRETKLETSAPEVSRASLGAVGPAADIYQLGRMIHDHRARHYFPETLRRLSEDMMQTSPAKRPSGVEVLQRLSK